MIDASSLVENNVSVKADTEHTNFSDGEYDLQSNKNQLETILVNNESSNEL